MTASPFSLEGRRALVTGGGRGLGAAMARGLGEAGARVALVARTAGEIEETAATISGSVPLLWDISDPHGMAALTDRAEELLDGPLDIVVHAAGIQHREPAETFPRADWERVLALNVSAPFFLSQEIGRRQLRDSRPGSHIFVGSLMSHLSGPGIVAYTASKSAVFGVIRNLSSEWAARGIRVNGIGPGYIRSRLTEAAFRDPQRAAQIADRIPMGRLGTAEDMAGTVVFLASDASAYITGQLIMVDGGWTAS